MPSIILVQLGDTKINKIDNCNTVLISSIIETYKSALVQGGRSNEICQGNQERLHRMGGI